MEQVSKLTAESLKSLADSVPITYMQQVQEQMMGSLYMDIEKALEKLIGRKFKDITGEELSKENIHRVTIVIPQYIGIGERVEVWTVDDIPMFDLGEVQINWVERDGWRVKVTRNYREYVETNTNKEISRDTEEKSDQEEAKDRTGKDTKE